MQPTHLPSVFANVWHKFYYNNNICYCKSCFYLQKKAISAPSIHKKTHVRYCFRHTTGRCGRISAPVYRHSGKAEATAPNGRPTEKGEPSCTPAAKRKMPRVNGARRVCRIATGPAVPSAEPRTGGHVSRLTDRPSGRQQKNTERIKTVSAVLSHRRYVFPLRDDDAPRYSAAYLPAGGAT